MEEYLAFVDIIGTSSEGNYIYRFDFTYDKDIAWGEFFNISPSILVPELKLDKNQVSSFIKAEYPLRMHLARKSSCFSMQDCIDGILPLCFSDLSMPEYIEYNDMPLFFMFGENKEITLEKIMATASGEVKDEKVPENTEIIDNLIKSLNDGDFDE